MSKESCRFSFVVDFEGVLGRFTGIPLCTKNDVVILNNLGAFTFLWISRKEDLVKLQEWIKNDSRLKFPDNITILQTRPKNAILWIKQFLRIPHTLPKTDFIYCSLFPGIRSLRSSTRLIRIHDPISTQAGRLKTFLEGPARLKLRVAKFLRQDAFRSVQRESVLLFNSNYTQRRVLGLYDIKPFNSFVLHSLVQFTNHDMEIPSHALSKTGQPYFVFIGGQRQRKDPKTIINLWANNSISEFTSFVVVGICHDSLLNSKAHQLKKTGRLKFLENLSEEELQTVILKSIGTVFYSYGEGWGQSLVESIYCGKWVICNDLEVFHEVIGKWGLFFPTDRPELSVVAMHELYNKREFYLSMEAEISSWSRKYGLENLGEAWLNVLQDFRIKSK